MEELQRGIVNPEVCVCMSEDVINILKGVVFSECVLTCRSPGPPGPQTTEQTGTGSTRLDSCSGESWASEDHHWSQ